MADITTTTAAVAIPELWTDYLLPAAEDSMIARRVSTTVMDNVGPGDTLHLPIIGSFTATAKTGGTDVTFSSNTDGERTIVLSNHFYVALVEENIVKKLAKPSYLAAVMGKAGTAVAQKVDTDVIALNDSLTEAVGTSTTTVTLTWANILAMIEDVDSNNVPPTERAFMFNAAGKQLLYALTNFTSSDFLTVGGVQRQSVASDPFGHIAGIPCYLSQKVTANEAYLIHKEAWGLGLADELIIMMETNDVRKQADLFSVAAIYGVKALRAGFGTVLHVT